MILKDIDGKSNVGVSVGIEDGMVTLVINASNGTSKAKLPPPDAHALARLLMAAVDYFDVDEDEAEAK